MAGETQTTVDTLQSPLPRIRCVEDFCRRYRLDTAEKQRLTAMFGAFAPERDLLLHATRAPVFS